ncbi:Hypothetical_protein [Hexamita inflata]|uniref:Hypothetical_protein n=1 Tax=Hexamita inflata TaxID=28002 RepID=A0AA86TB98_9EUKA|nr:Hypothetical protein HINF_LOCUS975 [Hexamita inflata]
MNNVLSTTITQVSNLQTQLDGTKSDVKTVQNQITGINGLINNINNVNAVQSADINTLKAQSGQNMNGAFWCMIEQLNNIVYHRYPFTGYCTNLKRCCWNHKHNKACITINPYGSEDYRYDIDQFTNDQCGIFVQF